MTDRTGTVGSQDQPDSRRPSSAPSQCLLAIFLWPSVSHTGRWQQVRWILGGLLQQLHRLNPWEEVAGMRPAVLPGEREPSG